MRFDVALVNGGCLEIFFDDLVGFRKARSDVANFEGQNLGDIGRLRGRRFDAARDHVLEQQGRIVRHGVVHIDDIRQCFVSTSINPQALAAVAASDAAIAATACPS